MFHPTRGGTRGGQDQFKWEDVKEDKHRENYLGNSLHAAVGRWQKGRDITWYAKTDDKDQDAATIQSNKKAEIQSIKDAEAEAMAEALGYKTKRKTETNVTEKELKSAISKNDNSVQDELDEKLKESSKIEGLGFRNRAQKMYSSSQSEISPRNYGTKANAVPVVPLIPHTGSNASNNDKEKLEGSSNKSTLKEESNRRHKRHRSRSTSQSRKSRRHRDRSRSKEHGGSTSGRDRDKDKDRERDRSSRGHHHEEVRRRGRSRSRSGTRERETRDRDTRDSRYRRGKHQEGEPIQRSVQRHRSRSRSRSRNHGHSRGRRE